MTIKCWPVVRHWATPFRSAGHIVRRISGRGHVVVHPAHHVGNHPYVPFVETVCQRSPLWAAVKGVAAGAAVGAGIIGLGVGGWYAVKAFGRSEITQPIGYTQPGEMPAFLQPSTEFPPESLPPGQQQQIPTPGSAALLAAGVATVVIARKRWR